MTQQQEGGAPTYPESDGEATDGHGTPGLLEEKSREARPGETGTTRVGMEGEDVDASERDGATENRNEETQA